MRGRDGVERFPQSTAVGLDQAILRSLRALDSSVTLQWVQDAIGIHEEHTVIRARNATIRARPNDAKGFFLSQLPALIRSSPSAPRPAGVAIRGTPFDDPYGNG